MVAKLRAASSPELTKDPALLSNTFRLVARFLFCQGLRKTLKAFSAEAKLKEKDWKCEHETYTECTDECGGMLIEAVSLLQTKSSDASEPRIGSENELAITGVDERSQEENEVSEKTKKKKKKSRKSEKSLDGEKEVETGDEESELKGEQDVKIVGENGKEAEANGVSETGKKRRREKEGGVGEEKKGDSGAEMRIKKKNKKKDANEAGKVQEEENVGEVEEEGDIEVEGGKEIKGKKGDKKRTANDETGTAAKAFQRVRVEEVEFVDERLKDNSYWAKGGSESGWGAKAQEILGKVRGKGFRHEKTKKKRGSYRGGVIDTQSHSIKFNYDSE